MRMSGLVGRQIKEAPKDARTVSHCFLVRGGYVRMVSAGIYSLLPLGKRIVAKIEQIIRDEMNRVGGQEVLLPVVLPAELWEESGRYQTVAGELLRFEDRNGKRMLLAMTHEEAVVHLLRSEVNSYKQLPVMLYQLQTKYRDEARPRAGLIRVREFTMKDAYSFHADQACLEEYYAAMHQAYVNIFDKIGLRQVLSIESESGMMGGKVSHEFMAIAETGEDTIFVSPDHSYRANREVAAAAWKFEKASPLPLDKVHTPDRESIGDVAAFLEVTTAQTAKAVFYRNAFSGELIFALIRGDFEVNESKLRHAASAIELEFATDDAVRAVGCEPGYASPLGIDPRRVKIIVDPSVAESSNLVIGANMPHYHYRNFNFDRDMAEIGQVTVADIATVREGDPCPVTGQPLKLARGIEVGNIFQLGTRYSESMGCDFLDKNGKSHPMTMGCYGIGVGRAMAAVIEQANDRFGPIWPITIAPYEVHLCALNYHQDDVRCAADRIYHDLTASGIEVLYDDRGEKAGFMFNDADLIGIPCRLIVSPRTLAAGKVEFKRRGERDGSEIEIGGIVDELRVILAAEYRKYGKAE